MRQRLGLADVLVKDPSVVILDEPTTSIDPVGVVEVLELVRSLARDQGVSVLLSSHLLHQVQQVCDRIAIFVAGDVVAMGTVAEIAGQPAARASRSPWTSAPTATRPRWRASSAGVPGRASASSAIRTIIGCGRVTAPPEARRGRAARRSSPRATRRGWCVTGAWSSTRSISATSRPARGRGRRRRRHDRIGDHVAAARRRPRTMVDPAGRPGRIPAGWRVIGAREFTEHLLSVRFIVLLLVLGLAGLLAIYAVAGTFRDVASADRAQHQVTGQPIPVFPLLFTTSPGIPGISGQSFPSFAGLVALLGPVLGIAFGFDAISRERSEGTLPRLVSQPIHRDDVINGKFVAGLAVIAMILAAVIAACCRAWASSGWASCPTRDVALRLVTWFLVAVALRRRSGWRSRRWPRWSSGGPRRRRWWSSPSGSC